ncbi:MAG: hypothetical protein ACI9M9_000926 [Flavobacteriaceae bacterium]
MFILKEAKKILVVIESLDVNDSSGTKGRVALLNSFIKAGYKITVLHYTQKEVQIDGMECISVKEKKGNFLFLLSRVQRLLYRWFKVDIGPWVDSRFGFSFGFFNDVKSLKKAVTNYNPEDFDMIWTLSKGNSYRPHKAVLSLPLWCSKWYAYVHDPYPQQLYPRPYNFVPYGYKKKRMFFRQVTIKAKRVVLPSLLLKEWLQSYYVALENKSLIIPHQILEHKFEDVSLPDYFDPQKFNLLHGGNLLDLRNPKPIIEAYSLFLKKHPEAIKNSSLLFLGKASAFSKYLSKKMIEIPSLYASEDYVLFEEAFTMQQKASVNIILEARSEISPFLPGKFAHCVSADKPILLIGPHYSETKRLLGDSYPYYFDFKEVNNIAIAIEDLYYKWQNGDRNIKLNRPDLKYYLSYQFVDESLKETLENLVV